MQELRAAALILLALIFLIRLPSALREPQARLSWMASGVGTLALLTLGTMVPQPALDGLLGGTNWINLAQNLLATVAFWLTMQAARTQGGQIHRATKWWPLPVVLVAFTIPFLFVTDRGKTSQTFIIDHIDQTAMLLYASIYMAAIAFISGLFMTGLPQQRPRPVAYWFLLSGALLVLIASVDEVIFLALAHSGFDGSILARATFALFDPLFYTGIIFQVAGLASFTVARWYRQIRLRVFKRELTKILVRRGFGLPVFDDSGADSLGDVYDLVIDVRDRDYGGLLSLSPSESAQVEAAERAIADRRYSPAGNPELGSRFIYRGATS